MQGKTLCPFGAVFRSKLDAARLFWEDQPLEFGRNASFWETETETKNTDVQALSPIYICTSGVKVLHVCQLWSSQLNLLCLDAPVEHVIWCWSGKLPAILSLSYMLSSKTWPAGTEPQDRILALVQNYSAWRTAHLRCKGAQPTHASLLTVSQTTIYHPKYLGSDSSLTVTRPLTVSLPKA